MFPANSDEIREMLDCHRHDRTGECDACHAAEQRILWIDWDSDDGPDPEWGLCRQCWLRKARALERKAKGGAA